MEAGQIGLAGSWQKESDKRKEEIHWQRRRCENYQISPTPYLDDIKEAAARLGYEVSLVRYQIIAYAERNNFCHRGLKALSTTWPTYKNWHSSSWTTDERSLDVIFRGRQHEQIELRKLIKIVEKEWFDPAVCG